MESLQKFYDKKRVLVTGGAGFIGSHLVEKLVSLGARVTIFDNFSAGSLANLKSVVHAINVIYADVRSPYSCLKATANQEIVFHLAAFISVPESFKDPQLCYNINIDGTNNMLTGCEKNSVKTFIYSSSSAVYGNKNSICSETDQLHPESPYAISKHKGELATKHYFQTYRLNTAILRYFNVYGQRQNPNGAYAAVVAKFTQQLLTKEPLTIFGDGKQTRDFIHVSKVVDANLMVAMHDALHGDVFNVGTGRSMNLLQLIDHLEKELKIQRTAVSFMPARQGDIEHSQANCEKYQKLCPSLLAKYAKDDSL
jgi:nucleoside-diphosphate-sugar epimerase